MGRERTGLVVMVGPARSVRGGVAAVVNALMESLPSDAPDVSYIPTHADVPKPVKAVVAAVGFLRVAVFCLMNRRGIVHPHVASNASFRRKYIVARLARLFGLPVIFHVHGAAFDVFYSGASPALKRRISSTLRGAALVIALSEEWRDRLLKMAPSARIRVLPNPVDCRFFARAIDMRRPAPERGGTLLFLGAFGKRKGVFDLLEAMDIVRRTRPAAVLELGGDQEVRAVRDIIATKGLADNVRVLGWVRGEEKLAAFARAHMLVLPSYQEGLPIAVLEALAAGLPIVTTPVGGIPEVVKDGVNGLLVKPGDAGATADAVLRLLGDADLRARMGRANVEEVRARFDAPAVAERLSAWYHEVLSSSSNGEEGEGESA